jgi:hypothetical protein
MTVNRGFLALCVACALLAALSLATAQDIAPAANENDFRGTWWLSAGPPAPRPFILTLNASGTFTLQDSIDGGGHTFSGASFSLTQGTWTRGPQRTAQALGLRFVYDASGKTMSVERVRLSVRLAENLDQMEGTYTIEQMFCTEQATPVPFTVPVCPDPSVAPTEVLRGPAPFTAVRVGLLAPLG